MTAFLQNRFITKYSRSSFILSIGLAHLLLWVSFFWQPISFWLLFTLALLILSCIAFAQENLLLKGRSIEIWKTGIFSGIFLYVVFFLGKSFISWTGIPLLPQLESLYALVQPSLWWHYVLLFVVIIPGEEFFWRGFVVKRLSNSLSPTTAILLGAVLYASAHLYAGTILLVAAAFIAGLVWGWIYLRTKHIAAAVLSHFVFNFLLLILLPLL